MVARGVVLGVVSVAVCACASAAPIERASLQSAVYIVGDDTPSFRASAGSGTSDTERQLLSIKRIYWFFAGR